MSRSQWIAREDMEHLLAACMPENRLALRVSMAFGMRIGDVLRMPTYAVRKGVWSFKEEKTGKRRRVRLGVEWQHMLLSIAGRTYVFEHRLDPMKHRTRQAVYKDLVRVAKAFRLRHISPHSARKIYAVDTYKRSGGNMKKVQRLLNHSDEAVTVLYALADELSAARTTNPRAGQKRHRPPPEAEP